MTDTEILHPDYAEAKDAFRDAFLGRADEFCLAHGWPILKDDDLPALFRNLDALSHKLWLRSVSVKV